MNDYIIEIYNSIYFLIYKEEEYNYLTLKDKIIIIIRIDNEWDVYISYNLNGLNIIKGNSVIIKYKDNI